MKFVRSFFNTKGQEVAGIWYDEERRAWRVSTIPVEGFATEDEAVERFKARCDPETGLISLHTAPEENMVIVKADSQSPRARETANNQRRRLGAGRSAPTARGLCRSEERRVGKECRYRWSPDH